jgi:arylsulfatase A-like enzyme
MRPSASGAAPGSRRLFVGRLLLLALLLAVIPAISACGGRSGPPDDAPHLLVITLDTARADRFSYTGASPVRTPAIDALAAEGTVFLQAVSPAPVTLPAHASLFTGRLPPGHGVRNNGTYRLPEEAVTLAEILRDRGYRTGAFVGAAVLAARYGLHQGFDHYDDAMDLRRSTGLYADRRGETVVEAALKWLAAQPAGPTFAWVHLFDPHMPYDPPEAERALHPDSPYDAEIAYSDRVIGWLLDGYRELGLAEEAVIVFTSDHGESLGEHGEMTHGVFLYDSTLRVPLIIRLPGRAGGGKITGQVSLMDLLPTLAGPMAFPIPDGLDGRDLGPLLEGGELDPAPAYSETLLPLENHGWFAQRGLRTERWKLISGPTTEIYDLEADPGEENDLAASEAGRAGELTRILEAKSRTQAVASRLEMDESTMDQLRALGYLAAPAGPRPSSAREPAESSDPIPAAPDPTIRRLESAGELFDRGLRDEAIELCLVLAASDPADERFKDALERMQATTGNSGDRTPPVDDASRSADEREEILLRAEIAVRTGDAPAARSLLTTWTDSLPDGFRAGAGHEGGEAPSSDWHLRSAVTISAIGNLSWDAGEHWNAVHAFTLGTRLVPDDPGFRYSLGLSWERVGDMHQALTAFEAALELNAAFPRAGAHRDYAEAIVQRLDRVAAGRRSE